MYDPTLHARLRVLADQYAQSSPSGHLSHYLQRLSANLHWMRELMGRLYGDREDFTEQFEGLIEDMFAAFRERPEELKKQDLEREQDANWMLSEERIGMMLYVDRFAGKLTDMPAKLAYLEELGVNWVHLMPLLDSPPGSNDGGYAVRDYRKVDERFGDFKDLHVLAKKMRKRDMLLTLDLVMNHTSDQHEWAQKALAGDPKYQDYYYFFPDRQLPDRFEETLPEVFPEASPGNFTYVQDLNQWVMSVFHHYQWDLNYTNPEVFREMLKVLLFLANQGVDILRLDAVAFTWKRLGTDSQNLPEAHWILQLMKACAQVVAPGVAFIAEAIVAPKEVVRYFGEDRGWGRECEIAYHATLMALLWDALATGETEHLRLSVKAFPPKPDRTTWITYLRCHDDIGLGFDENHLYALGKDPWSHKQFIVSYYTGNFPDSPATGLPFSVNTKTGDARISGEMSALVGLEKGQQQGNQAVVEQAIKRIEMLHSVIFSYGGLPLLYYGDEVGTLNNYAYENDPDQSYDNRWVHRPILDWEKVAGRKVEGSVEQRIFDAVRRLAFIRKSSPEFADHNTRSLEDTDNAHIFSYLRWNGEGARTLCLANFSPDAQTFSSEILHRCGLNPGEVMDKVTGAKVQWENHRIRLEGYGFLWLTEPATYKAFQKGKSLKKLQKDGLWPKG